jgi:hypothetical protein
MDFLNIDVDSAFFVTQQRIILKAILDYFMWIEQEALRGL